MENLLLLGAIAGDAIGSVYERHSTKRTDFALLAPETTYTDDTVLTIAVAKWLLDGGSLTGIMQDYGRRYPYRGYGGRFKEWLSQKQPLPYQSFGNGSAMRVSPVGWACQTLEETLEMAARSAAVTHNHPEGIKGAQATASCIYLARTGASKPAMKAYVESTFGYDLHRTCDGIRPAYRFDVSCQGSVPESIIAFMESTDYESAVRLAISLGCDADTMAAITGSIAKAFYHDIPSHIATKVMKKLPEEFKEIIRLFDLRFGDTSRQA